MALPALLLFQSEKFSFFRHYIPKNTDYTVRKYLPFREFSGLSEYLLTLKKTHYLTEDLSKILNTKAMRKLTFSESDHDGAFIPLD